MQHANTYMSTESSPTQAVHEIASTFQESQSISYISLRIVEASEMIRAGRTRLQQVRTHRTLVPRDRTRPRGTSSGHGIQGWQHSLLPCTIETSVCDELIKTE